MTLDSWCTVSGRTGELHWRAAISSASELTCTDTVCGRAGSEGAAVSAGAD
ncbi:MAG TPA: hypothetical protein PLN53_02635 [Terricaulis sp.]|nr:hypothetical protein [Terricaulis sp.]